MNITIHRAAVDEAKEILSMQKLAYQSEAEIYNDFFIEPLVQTLGDVKDQFEEHTFFTAKIEATLVGSVRGRLEKGICYIGKLMVHPDYQNRGIGKKLMREMELFFNSCLKYELFTGDKSEKNLHVYEKMGYQVFMTKRINDHLSLVFMEKHNQK